MRNMDVEITDGQIFDMLDSVIGLKLSIHILSRNIFNSVVRL